MSDLYPTPTRLALLREVDARHVVDGDISADEQRHGHAWLVGDMPHDVVKVTARIAEMVAAGWVELHDPSAQYRLTASGRLVLAAGGA